MGFSASVKRILVGAVGAAIMAISSAAQSGVALPDVVGIRPGMTPQEAYNALKARGNGAKVGVGQLIVNGVSDKPVAVIMSVQMLGASPREVITAWLTFPPARQQVWAVRRTLQLDQEHEMLKSRVVDGLVQKYGPEASAAVRQPLGIMDPNIHFWTFDDQGGRLDHSNGCLHAGLMNLGDPQDPAASLELACKCRRELSL